MAREGDKGKENQRIQLKLKEKVEARLSRPLYDLIRHSGLHSSRGKRRVREFLSKQVTASDLFCEGVARQEDDAAICDVSPLPTHHLRVLGLPSQQAGGNDEISGKL